MADERPKRPNSRGLQPNNDENVPFSAAASLKKVNKLSEKLERQLTGTLHGELYEGTRSSNVNRHQQLPGAFQLREELNELKSTIQSQRTHEQNEADEKRLGRPSASMIAAIINIVAERLDTALRDSNIRIARMEEEAAKASQRNVTLQEKIEALEAKVKKAAPKPGCTSEQFQAVQRRLIQAEQKHKQLQEENESLRNAVTRADSKLADVLSKVDRKAGCTRGEFLGLQQRIIQVDQIQAKLDGVETKVENTKTNLEARLKAVDVRIKGLTNTVDQRKSSGDQTQLMSSKIDSLSQRVQEFALVQKQAQKTSNVFDELTKKLEEISTTLESNDKETRKTSKQVAAVWEKVLEISIVSLESSSAETRDIMSKVTELSQTVEEIASVIGSLTWTVENFDQDFAEKFDRMQTYTVTLLAGITDAMKAQRRMEADVLRKEMDELTSATTQCEIRSGDHSKAIKDLKAAMKKHYGCMKEHDSRINGHDGRIKEHDASIQEHDRRITLSEEELYFSVVALDKLFDQMKAHVSERFSEVLDPESEAASDDIENIGEDVEEQVDAAEEWREADQPLERTRDGLQLMVEIYHAGLEKIAGMCSRVGC